MVRIELRDYQRAAIDAVFHAHTTDIRRPGIAMATGGGKSVVLAKAIEESGERALVVSHRKEIVEQNAQKLGYFLDPFDIGIVMAGTKQVDRPIVVASIQTLAGNRRLLQAMGRFGFVAIDEAHHAAAPTWVDTLRHFGVGKGLPTKALGVTATWDRSDGVGLDHVIDEIVYTIDIETLIVAGHLCDIEAIQVITQFDESGNGARDWSDADVAQRVSDANLAGPLAAAVQEHAPGRTSLVFSPDVKTAFDYRDALRQVGIPAEVVSGETPKRQREQILRDFKAGRIKALCNCSVFTEGTDIPIVDCIVMGRPTKSRSLFQQMLGRGLRTYPGKENCIVLDIVGSTNEHRLQTTASLLGLPLSPGKTKVGSVRTRLVNPADDPDFDYVGFQISTQKKELLDRKKMAWTQVELDAFSLPAGDGSVVIAAQADGTWNVVQFGRDTTEEIARGLDIGYAQGVAETRVLEAEARILADPKARWRSQPASEKQIAALLRMRIEHQPGITKGEATDLIDARINRGRLKQYRKGATDVRATV